MKKLLLSLSALLVSGLSFGQSIDAVTAPTVIQMGTAVTFGFTYTSAVAPTEFQIQIFKRSLTDPSGVDFPSGGHDLLNKGYQTPLPAAPGGGGIAGPFTVNLPAVDNPTPPSYSPLVIVPGGTDNYVWFIKMVVNGVSYEYNPKPLVSFTAATLATQSFSAISGSEMYVSNASKSLVVNQSNLKSESASVYDVTGRAVTTIKNLKQTASHDLSSLRKGVYFIVTNDKRKLKFAL
jgi:hypothetical protein